LQDLIESSTLTKKIKSLCINAGFSAVGVSKAEIITDESDYFLTWLSEGRNAGMEWLKTTYHQRINPFKIFPEVKSIISLAYIYNTPFKHKEQKNIPKISKHAWGNVDYHKVIKRILKELCIKINFLVKNQTNKTITTVYFVDTAPIMEKYWAIKSGVGWRGKNTIVINPQFGSFFFIGTIFLNLELEYDTAIDNICNECDICLKSCPTGALYNEYKLDANRCISYHTIENKNEIPDDINLHNWIYGCDICQNVCPYNNVKKTIYSQNKDFNPKNKFFNKSKDLYLNVTEEEFHNEFSNSPLSRLKFQNWIRNLRRI